LESRIVRLEKEFGDDDTPQRIIIWCGPDLIDNTVKFEHGQYYFDVPCERDDDTMEHLSPEQKAIIRPGDRVVIIQFVHNGRDNGILPNVRRRLDDDGRAYASSRRLEHVSDSPRPAPSLAR